MKSSPVIPETIKEIMKSQVLFIRLNFGRDPYTVLLAALKEIAKEEGKKLEGEKCEP